VTDERILDVAGLVKSFPTQHGLLRAVRDVSFSIRRGEALGLVGESGSGKTTVGRCILRLIQPDAGTVRFRGEDVLALSPRQFRRLRSRIQIVFQDPYDALNPRIRIGDAIVEPLRLTAGLPSRERRERAARLLRLVGLDEGVADVYPHQVSAGAQQRVGIARAISTEPDLVVLDEPTSALDVSIRAEILTVLQDLQATLGVSYLFISHDLTAVRRLCHRVAIMYLGEVVELGETEALFERPLHPYARALLSSVLYPDPRQTRSTFTLSGEIPSPVNVPAGCTLHTRCPLATPACSEQVPAFEERAPGRWLSCIHVDREAGSSGA
jgi:oligopeptide/dipeptide ABC transporter ATP-binding protein